MACEKRSGWNGPDFESFECTLRERQDSGPRCLWCGLMGRTGERVPQLCVSRIFDGGSERREQWGTGNCKRWVRWKGGKDKNGLKHPRSKDEWKCTVINTAAALCLPLMIYPTLLSDCTLQCGVWFTNSVCCTGVNVWIKSTWRPSSQASERHNSINWVKDIYMYFRKQS